MQLWKYQAKMNIVMREIEEKKLMYERTVKRPSEGKVGG